MHDEVTCCCYVASSLLNQIFYLLTHYTIHTRMSVISHQLNGVMLEGSLWLHPCPIPLVAFSDAVVVDYQHELRVWC